MIESCSLLLTGEKSKWYTINGINFTLYYQGTYILINNKHADSNDLLNHFDKIDFDKKHSLDLCLSKIDGFFSIIIEKNDFLFVIVDRLRSFPIFYVLQNNEIFISDTVNALKNRINFSDQNDNGIREFFFSGYCIGNDTLYNDLKILLPGKYLMFDKNIREFNVESYFSYFPSCNDKNPVIEDKLDTYWNVISNSFNRLSTYIIENNITPVIPLSGGRDSRLLAVMLKHQNVNNAVCFTFGSPGHEEVVKSKEVADSLGYRWLFEPYTKEKWNYEYCKGEIKELIKYSSEYSVIPPVTLFIAVKNLFPDANSRYLFLPGHTLDFLAGGHIPKSLFIKKKLSMINLLDAIMEKHFSFHYILKKDRLKISKRIETELSSMKLETDNDLISAFEFWDWRERQSKFIMNSLNVYNYCGFDWYMPFWEKGMMDFFSSLPSEWRYKQNFERYALNKFFPDYFEKSDWIVEKCINESNFRYKIKQCIPNGIKQLILTIRKKLTTSTLHNYGLERYGAFDKKSQTLEEFTKKYVSKTDVKHILYFSTIDYLHKYNFNLSALNSKYKKTYRSLMKNNRIE